MFLVSLMVILENFLSRFAMCKYFHGETIENQNKNAFQWDAYHPLFIVRGVSLTETHPPDRDPQTETTDGQRTPG